MQTQSNIDPRIKSIEFSSKSEAQPLSAQAIPEIVLDTLSLVCASIQNGLSLIITTPSKDSFGLATATLLALNDQLKSAAEERTFHDEDGIFFTPGDKLKMGNAIVEFVRFDAATGGVVVRYNPSSPLTHTLTYQQSLALQKTKSSRRLSPTKKFNEERRKLKEQSGWAAEARSSITFSKSSIAFVGPLGRSKAFFTSTLLDGNPVNTLLLCSQVDYDNSDMAILSTIGRGQYSGTPALITAADLCDLLQLSQETLEKIKAIVIDVDNFRIFIERNLVELRSLQRKKIPLFAIVSNTNAAAADLLRDEGFLKWRWDSRTLGKMGTSPEGCDGQDSPSHPFFRNLNLRCRYSVEGSVQLTVVEDPQINELYSTLMSINAHFEDEATSATAEDIRIILWRTFIALLRTPVPFQRLERQKLEQEVSSWQVALLHERGYVSENLLNDFKNAFDLVLNILKTGNNKKEQAIRQIIEEAAFENSVTIVVNTLAAVKEAHCHWIERQNDFLSTHIKILPFSSLKASRTPVIGRLIVVGWLGKERMAALINSSIAKIVHLVLYQGCETQWYLHQTNAWRKAAIDTDDAKRVLSIPGITYERDLDPLPAPVKLSARTTESQTEIVEELWRQNAYSRHEARGEERSSSVQAIPILFAGDYLAFYRENSRLTDVTAIIEGQEKQAKSLRVGDASGLNIGSFVLLKEAGRDLIEQLADRLSLKDSAQEIRLLASAWREALDRLYAKYDGDSQAVYRVLQHYGMRKGYQAFKGLKADSDRISLGRNHGEIVEAVRAFAKALHDKELDERADRIAEAGIRVQTAHRLAGRRLSDTLASAFTNYMTTRDISKPEDIWEPVEFDIEGLGAVKLCRIIEIDRSRLISVPDWKTGKLLKE